MIKFWEIFCFLFLFSPTIGELENDRKGDFNKTKDVWIRIIVAVAVSVIADLLTGRNMFAAFALSMAIHFALFDYLIAYILIKNGTLEPPRGVKYHWFSYSAKVGAIDNLKFWKRLNPWWKLTVRIVVLGIALTIYFI